MSKDQAKKFISHLQLDDALNRRFLSLLGKSQDEMIKSIVSMGSDHGFSFSPSDYIVVTTTLALETDVQEEKNKKH